MRSASGAAVLLAFGLSIGYVFGVLVSTHDERVSVVDPSVAPDMVPRAISVGVYSDIDCRVSLETQSGGEPLWDVVAKADTHYDDMYWLPVPAPLIIHIEATDHGDQDPGS